MGICPDPRNKNSDIPALICYIKSGNAEQKKYCTKLINKIYNENVRYDIQPSNYFSIKFRFNGIIHIVKNDSDLSDNSMAVIIKQIHKIIQPQTQSVIVVGPQTQSIVVGDGDSFFKDEESSSAKSNSMSQSLNILEKNILTEQLNKRDNTSYENSANAGDDIKINKELENMCNLGIITKNKIREEKKKNPHKYIEVKDALQLEKKDQGLFALGLLGDIFQQNNTEVIIEKDDNGKDELDAGTTFLQFISNGLANKKKYDLHFDFGDKRNNELLNNSNEYEKFKKKLLLKLSKDYNIPTSKIIVTFPQKGSFSVQVIFQSDEFNNLDLSDFKQKFKNDKSFPELQKLKEIHTSVIMEGCKLSKNQLDSEGNRTSGWAVGQNRGNKPYNPPIGWIGIGLKVKNKYDKGNNEWIGMNNSKGEWCVAYHGVGYGQNPQEVQNTTGLIVKTQFKPGGRQACENHEDIYHPGNKVGVGVYCTPSIDVAAGYSGITEINKVKYQTVLMVRVKPEAIRASKKINNYWVVNGTTDEIRPYRILYKQI